MKEQILTNVNELLVELADHHCIQILCNEKQNLELLNLLTPCKETLRIGYCINHDPGYERMRVKEYLHFFKQLYGSNVSVKEAMRQMKLEDVGHKKIQKLSMSQLQKMLLARAIIQDSDYCFLQTPLAYLCDEDKKTVLNWLESHQASGKRFLISSYSLRDAYFIDSELYSMEENRFRRLPAQEEESIKEQNPLPMIIKIQGKWEDRTFLFDPNEIDYIESEGGISQLSIKGRHYQSALSLEELEKTLKRFGFFRCHRSYIVNLQRIREIEKWTRNSYSLKLSDGQNTCIPLSKGRIEELRSIFQLEF